MESQPAFVSGLEAVVFDLDGVLVDSETVWDAARRAVVEEAGGRWQAKATRAMMGMSSPEWSRYLRKELGVPLAPKDISDRVVERMIEAYHEHLPMLPGAASAVRRLAERWPLAVASSANRPVIDAALEAAELAPCFTATVSGDEVSRGKPAPDVYLEAARQLGVDPRHAAGVEDSSNGLRAAFAAGMLVVAVPNREFPPDQDALSLATIVIDSLDALTESALLELSPPA